MSPVCLEKTGRLPIPKGCRSRRCDAFVTRFAVASALWLTRTDGVVTLPIEQRDGPHRFNQGRFSTVHPALFGWIQFHAVRSLGMAARENATAVLECVVRPPTR